jgi:hypothetical protein
MMRVGMTMMRRGSRGVWGKRSLDFLSFGTDLRRFERVADGLHNGRKFVCEWKNFFWRSELTLVHWPVSLWLHRQSRTFGFRKRRSMATHLSVLSILLIHAAGHHEARSSSNALDRVVSTSYTTSFRSLLHSLSCARVTEADDIIYGSHWCGRWQRPLARPLAMAKVRSGDLNKYI